MYNVQCTDMSMFFPCPINYAYIYNTYVVCGVWSMEYGEHASVSSLKGVKPNKNFLLDDR